MKKALRKAASDTSKESRAPGHRVKKMTVVLDKALVESAEFMTELTTELSALDVGYQVGSDDLYPGSVLWKRMISERTVDENARVNTTPCVIHFHKSDSMVRIVVMNLILYRS